jgi:hypothetical protein
VLVSRLNKRLLLNEPDLVRVALALGADVRVAALETTEAACSSGSPGGPSGQPSSSSTLLMVSASLGHLSLSSVKPSPSL